MRNQVWFPNHQATVYFPGLTIRIYLDCKHAFLTHSCFVTQTNKKTEGGLGKLEKEGTAPFSVTDTLRTFPCTSNGKFGLVRWQCTAVIFLDEWITSCQIVLRFPREKISTIWRYIWRYMAVDFDHLSLQIGNIEPKQEQWRAVEALLLGKYVMAVLPLVSARPLLMRALPSLKRIRVTEIKRHRSW